MASLPARALVNKKIIASLKRYIVSLVSKYILSIYGNFCIQERGKGDKDKYLPFYLCLLFAHFKDRF